MIKRWGFQIVLILLLFGALGAAPLPQSGGTVWSNPVDITSGVSNNVRSFDALVCDPYQNVHLFWADQTERGAAIFYRNDASGSWSFPTDVIATRDTYIFYLRAAVSQQAESVHLTWVNSVFNGLMYYSSAPLSSASDPTAWMAARIIATGVTNSDIGVDSEGNIHMVYSVSDDTGINQDVYHIVSNDDGQIWSDPELIYSRTFSQSSSIQTWMAIDGKNRIHVGLTLRSQEYGATSEVGYIRSLEDGKGWREYQKIDAQGTTFQGVAWIAPYAFGDNEIHLTWHDPRRMHQWSMDGGETWSQPEEIMALGGAFGGPNDLTRDSSGVVHVVTAVSNGVFHASWKEQRWSAPEQIDSRNIDPHGQRLITCQGNQLHMVYYDRTGEETVWYATRRVIAPRVEREPIPLPTPTTDLGPLTTVTAATTPENTRVPLPTQSAQPPMLQSQSTLARMLSGILPALLLVGGILAAAAGKLRK